MSFNELDGLIKCAPFWCHAVTSGILVGGLANLILVYSGYINKSISLFGFKDSFLHFINLNTPCFKKRLILSVSLFFNFIVFFGKVGDKMYTMLDIFLPLYVCYYFLAKETITSLQKEMITFNKMCENEQ